jgi:putative protein kinase ArgK-like GTPase of G3E family
VVPAVPPSEGGIAPMTVTITRAQREALYQEMLTDLSGVGDIYITLNAGNGDGARRLWQRFDAELRLLDQLGWDAADPREQVAVDLRPGSLVRVLAHMQERAEHTVSEELADRDENRAIAQRAVEVLAACRSVLAQLADSEQGGDLR